MGLLPSQNQGQGCYHRSKKASRKIFLFRLGLIRKVESRHLKDHARYQLGQGDRGQAQAAEVNPQQDKHDDQAEQVECGSVEHATNDHRPGTFRYGPPTFCRNALSWRVRVVTDIATKTLSLVRFFSSALLDLSRSIA